MARRRAKQCELPLDPTAAAVERVRAATNSRGRPEGEVLAGVLRFLRVLGCVVWRENSGTILIPGPGGERGRALHLAPLGQPDVTALVPHGRWCPEYLANARRRCGCPRPWGLMLCVETKAKGARPTAQQISRQEHLRQSGALVLTVQSAGDLRDGMRAAGLDVP